MKNIAKNHYHWLVAGIIFLEMAIFGGIVNSFVVYTVPIVDDFNVTYGAFSLAGTPYGIISFLSSIVVVVLFRRFGYRKITVISLCIAATGMILISLSQDLYLYGLGKSLFGAGFGSCFTTGAVVIIKNWFQRHQGLVLGIVTMASGIGGGLMSFILTQIIVTTNWRMASLFSGALLIAIAIPYLLIRNHPKDLGLQKYGEGNQNQARKIKQRTDLWPGYSGKVILRRPLFYLTCLTVGLSCISVTITSSTIVAFFQDAGYSATAASSYNTTIMLTLAVVKLAAGWFSDRYGAKPLTFLCVACAAIGHLMLTTISSPSISYISAGIFSVGICITSLCIPLMTVPLFGYRGSLEVNGYLLSLPSFALIVATPLANFSRDYFGSYTEAYFISFIVDLATIILFAVIFPMGKRDQKKYLESNN